MSQPKAYILTRDLPLIPAKRYFTIGEVSDLCDVRSYVLRYWEQEFAQLRPMKRRGNRRYYQLHEVQLVRRIRELLYEQGFTIAGARNQLEQKMAEDVMAFELSPINLDEHTAYPAAVAINPDADEGAEHYVATPIPSAPTHNDATRSAVKNENDIHHAEASSAAVSSSAASAAAIDIAAVLRQLRAISTDLQD